MARVAIADTGPLVAYFDRSERNHGWALERMREFQAPLLVCEPVLAEVMYLLADLPKAQDALFALLENGALRIAFQLEDHLPAVRSLHVKYRDQPMSLADACIVRMAEIYEDHVVLTLDSDFSVYRRHGRKPLELVSP